jgi:hypothetical protein
MHSGDTLLWAARLDRAMHVKYSRSLSRSPLIEAIFSTVLSSSTTFDELDGADSEPMNFVNQR